MGTYQITPVLSLTALPESPRHYGRPSEAKKPSCATTPIIPTPTSTSLSLQEPTMQTPHPTLSLELVSCQEDYLNNEETSVDQDQDSFIPFQIFQDLVPPSQEPHSPPSPMSCTSTKKDQDIFPPSLRRLLMTKRRILFLCYLKFLLKRKVFPHPLVLILHIHFKTLFKLQMHL